MHADLEDQVGGDLPVDRQDVAERVVSAVCKAEREGPDRNSLGPEARRFIVGRPVQLHRVSVGQHFDGGSVHGGVERDLEVAAQRQLGIVGDGSARVGGEGDHVRHDRGGEGPGGGLDRDAAVVAELLQAHPVLREV